LLGFTKRVDSSAHAAAVDSEIVKKLCRCRLKNQQWKLCHCRLRNRQWKLWRTVDSEISNENCVAAESRIDNKNYDVLLIQESTTKTVPLPTHKLTIKTVMRYRFKNQQRKLCCCRLKNQQRKLWRAAYSETGNENCVAADSGTSNENRVIATLEICNYGGVISGFNFVLLGDYNTP